ncbi:MAG: hypothetical protein FJ315_01885, partial [SAR202 cluster bacterium]|nr:hypothetical protein [SAR202 cluster bacterium]
MAGRFEVDGDSVCFMPRFPFVGGMGYSLLVRWPPEGSAPARPEVWTVQRPAKALASTTDVLAIYPSSERAPLNLLKLYVHFSNPMSEGRATRAVHVLRADDREPLDGVFLVMEPELWDRERRRLTLLLDPARIKRGLVPHEEAGYPLTEGVPVVVTVDRQFRDASGRPLRQGTERRYEVGPPVRARVDPAAWKFRWPAAGSTDPLTVEFDRPLDHALLQHSLRVLDGAGMPVAGRGSTGAGEGSWRFEPRTAWREGRYVVAVNPLLEDLAGNSLVRVFDRDLMRAEDAPAAAAHVAIGFTCALRHGPHP